MVGFPYTPSFVEVKSRLLLSNIVAFSCISPVILAEEQGKKERPECLKTGLWKEQNMITLDGFLSICLFGGFNNFGTIDSRSADLAFDL